MTSDSRFHLLSDDLVEDRSTGLVWTRDAGSFEFLLSWSEGLAAIGDMNRDAVFGRTDWRLSNRVELRSLVDHGEKQPALPTEHPFTEPVDTCWSAKTSGFDPDWAFALYLKKGAVGVGHKKSPGFSVWPVRAARW